MNVLLKIVQGPNAGAEIILAEGMTISVGKGDSCDILLADQSLADTACELEVGEGRVRMLLPGGAEERLEPFHVKFLGETTAVAVGPETGAWDELVWPVRGAAASAEESAGEDSGSSVSETDAVSENQPASGKKKTCGCGCIVALAVLLSVVFTALVFLLWPIRSRVSGLLGPAAVHVRPVAVTVHDAGIRVAKLVKGVVAGCVREKAKEECVPRPPDIRDVAAEYALAYTETDGAVMLSGNFTTRARRLAATAAAYSAKPGVKLDLSDDESLLNAASEVLELVSEGKLKVHSATNRVLALSGFAPSAVDLRMTLEAIRADVPNVKNVDCTRVRLGELNGVAEITEPASAAVSGAPAVSGVKTARVRRDKRKSTAPRMPVVGVMTFPYPCLVLNDGSRVTEGAEFGGFIIEKIGADTIRVRGPEGTFEWRP